MTNIRTHIIVPVALLCLLLGAIHTATASEVTGTLSSDGSNETTQGAVMGETNVENSGRLQGSVVQGREESAAAALSNPSSWNTSTWIISLSIIGLIVLGYFFWQRRIA